MKKSFVKKYIINKYTVISAIILVMVVYFGFLRSGKSPIVESTEVKMGNIVERVSVTGKILPVEKADLAFEKSGVIAKINVKVGDRISKGKVIASLENAGEVASLASAQAKLDDLVRGLRPEELGVEKSKVDSASIALENAKQDALNAVRSGYVQVQGAVNNYLDVFFDNPQSVNPTINISTQSQALQYSINNKRLVVSDTLKVWKDLVDSANSTNNIAVLISRAGDYLSIIKSFTGDLSTIVNNLSPVSSGMSQTAIDALVSSMNSGLSAENQAITSVTGAKTNLENAIASYEQANNNFILKNAGSSQQSINAQSATVASYKAELEKSRIVAPVDGLITKVEPSVGEFVSPGNVVFSIQSDGIYKIEAFVAESDIARIVIGNQASTTLDAYGQYVDFPAVVTSIDPAETVLEGVPTYKVVLYFNNKDSRIRSGMTANLEILTKQRSGVLVVPSRAIIDSQGSKTIRVLKADGKNFTIIPVETGLKGSDGMIEIISGVSEGEKVVTYVK